MSGELGLLFKTISESSQVGDACLCVYFRYLGSVMFVYLRVLRSVGTVCVYENVYLHILYLRSALPVFISCTLIFILY